MQELAQSRKLPQPRYAIVRERGPGAFQDLHRGGPGGQGMDGQAEGATKKLAAQRAAQQVYQRLLDQPAETRLP